MFKKKLRKINQNVKIKFFFTVYPKIKKIVKANTLKDIKIKKEVRISLYSNTVVYEGLHTIKRGTYF